MRKQISSRLLALAVALLSVPGRLAAQGDPAPIFGGGQPCTADAECSSGFACNTLGRCVSSEAGTDTEAGLRDIEGGLEGSGITGTADFGELIIKFVNFSLPYLALAAFVGFIYAGFLYVTAYGNDEQVQKSKKILIYAVAGLVLVILSFSIVQLFAQGLAESVRTQ